MESTWGTLMYQVIVGRKLAALELPSSTPVALSAVMDTAIASTPLSAAGMSTLSRSAPANTTDRFPLASVSGTTMLSRKVAGLTKPARSAYVTPESTVAGARYSCSTMPVASASRASTPSEIATLSTT